MTTASPPATSRRRLPPLVLRLLILLAIVEVLLPVVLALARNKLMFMPFREPSAASRLSAFRGMDGRVVHVTRPDGRRLEAYDVTRRGFAPDGPVVLFLHGNAGNIGMRAEVAAWFAAGTGARLLMPDYSGFGGNEGSPSEGELDADALAAFDHLVAEGVPPGRIVVYGESIGGGPALTVATRRRPAGVVLQSSPASLSSMALRVYPWLPLAALFVRGSFPNAARAAEVEVPLLVVHGRGDTIVPFAEGERIAREAGARAEFLPVEGADHNDLLDVAGEDYLLGLAERFRRWTSR